MVQAIFILSNIDAALDFVMIIEGLWFALLSDKDGPIVYFNDTTAWPHTWWELNYKMIVAFADALMVRPDLSRFTTSD